MSYYDHPELMRLYPRWTLRTIEVTKALTNANKRDAAGPTKATEVFLINGPSLVEPQNKGLFG